MLCNICAIYLFLNACFQEQETLAHAVHEMALNNDAGWRKRLKEKVGRTIAQFSLLPNGKLLNCCVGKLLHKKLIFPNGDWLNSALLTETSN